MISKIQIEDVYKKIEQYLIHTPLHYSPILSNISGAEVYFKLENLQVSGSFKLRGVRSQNQRGATWNY